MFATRMIWPAGALALGMALLQTIPPAAAADAMAKAGDITASAAWARATAGRTGVTYLTLRNDGAEADRLVAAATGAAKTAQLHVTKEENGVMKMRPVDAIDLPPHAAVTLAPGGYHIMLMGLAKPLKAGGSFPLTLTLQKAGQLTVTVAVKSAGATSPGQGSMDHMDHMDMDKMDRGSGQ